MKRNRPQPDDFHIGWITALPIEFTAARMMLDEEYESEDETSNDYTIGRIGHHNIVLTCLPAGQIGTTAAATAAAQISSNFPLKFGLLVGIGGGVPTEETDIRLGDVVISQPNGEYGGVVQHDLGKATAGGKWKRTGYLNAPPEALLKAVSKMRSDKMMGKALIHQYLPSPSHFPMFDRAKAGRDVLFLPNYDHVNGPTCNECRQDMIIDRSLRGTDEGIEAHYGTIASGNQVIKDAHTRDKLSAELGGVLCFEMEAAGLMNSLPSLVIRGICDYADSHKNKTWQPFAAVTAAACAKQILSILPRSSVLKSPLAQGQLAEQISFRDLVVLNDALGNKHVFSLRFVPSTEVFVNILKSLFTGVGSQKIERSEWLLQDHHSKRVLDLNKPWLKLVKPGQVLDMSMIFRQRHVTSQCPWCKSESRSPPDVPVECKKCGRTFHRIEEINEIDIQDSNARRPSPSLSSAPKTTHISHALSPKPKSMKHRDENADISLYTRVQVINTRFRPRALGRAKSAVRQLILTQQELNDRGALGEYLANLFHGLSEEDCLDALTECGIQQQEIVGLGSTGAPPEISSLSSTDSKPNKKSKDSVSLSTRLSRTSSASKISYPQDSSDNQRTEPSLNPSSQPLHKRTKSEEAREATFASLQRALNAAVAARDRELR